MPARRLSATFVTGTDTGVGKTLVASAIVAWLRSRGRSVGVYKPVETGCRRVGEELAGEDVDKLLAAGGSGQQRATASSYLFELPAAPLVAAEAAGQRIDPDRLAADLDQVARRFDRVVVEGAGGLLVPIADGYTYLDLAKRLDLSVLVVVGSQLGCINHALLTLGTLEAAGVSVHGYIVNTLTAESAAGSTAAENRRAIGRFTKANDLGVFPFITEGERGDPNRLAALAHEHLDLTSLL